MIRFIDLRGQILLDDDLPKEEQEWFFSFWDTVIDEYLMFSGEEMWHTWGEFIRDYHGRVEDHDPGWDRLKGLAPEALRRG